MHKLKYLTISIILVMSLSLAGPLFDVSARPLQAISPTLGAAASFAVLGASAVTNTGPTILNGDLGISPNNASSITGFPPGLVTGVIHAADAVALQAQNDLITAYNAMTSQACDFGPFAPTDLGGQTLTPGVYCFSSSVGLTGALTLNAQGDPNAVWVFKIGSTLTTASASSVVLINSASPCNVLWQVGSSATLGTTTAFKGHILALASITVNTGVNIIGRALARTGAVTLDTNNVSFAACAAPPGSTLTPTPPEATQTAIAPTLTAIAMTPTATLPPPTLTAIAATQTAIAATNTVIAPTLTAIAQTLAPSLTAQAATQTAIAFTLTPTPTPTSTPTSTPTNTPIPAVLPSTGFDPQHVTVLSAQPAEKVYADLGDLWLEIPRLGVQMPIVGVPQQADGEWDVSWLGNQAGWLNGSAFPTWAGNSVLTAHVYGAYGNSGPFVHLNWLWWGDKVIVHAWGAQYVYEVRSVQQISPADTAAMMKHEDLPWVTLMTCRGYDEASNSYKYRVLVRAVLVEVK
jgi:type VI secretion system secreted protein VgrG